MPINGVNHVRRFDDGVSANAFLAHSLREKSLEIERFEREAREAISSRPGIAAYDEDKGWLATFGREVLFRSRECYVQGTNDDARDMCESRIQTEFDRAVEEEVWEALKVWENAKEDYERTSVLTGTYGGNLPIVLRECNGELVYVRVGSPGNQTLMTVMGLWDEQPRHVPVSELSLPHLPFVDMDAEAAFLDKVCPAGAIVERHDEQWIKVQSGWLSERFHHDALPDGMYRVQMFADFS